MVNPFQSISHLLKIKALDSKPIEKLLNSLKHNVLDCKTNENQCLEWALNGQIQPKDRVASFQQKVQKSQINGLTSKTIEKRKAFIENQVLG